MARSANLDDNTFKTVPKYVVYKTINRTVQCEKKYADTHHNIDPVCAPMGVFRKIVVMTISFMNVQKNSWEMTNQEYQINANQSH